MNIADYKCINCNSKLTYNPVDLNWKCEYCGNKYTVEMLKVNKIRIDEMIKDLEKHEYKSYSCPDCGAKIILGENTITTECMYCGNTAIVIDRLKDEFKPDGVIPFEIDRKKAINLLKKYVSNEEFKYKKKLQNIDFEKISGMYVPFFIHDINFIEQAEFHAGMYETSASFAHINVEGDVFFYKIPTDASQKFLDELMDQLEPYDYNKIDEFDYAYLSGFMSEKFDMDKEELKKRVYKRVNETAKTLLVKKLRPDYYVQKVIDYKIEEIKKMDSKYVLMPVWMVNFRSGSYIYTLALNGQTGKIVVKREMLEKDRRKMIVKKYTAIVSYFFIMFMATIMAFKLNNELSVISTIIFFSMFIVFAFVMAIKKEKNYVDSDNYVYNGKYCFDGDAVKIISIEEDRKKVV